MTKLEQIARIMWTALARSGTYDEDRHGDVPAYLDVARAAIEALREPTPTMCASAVRLWETTLRDTSALHIGARMTWEVMIDAILNEKPE